MKNLIQHDARLTALAAIPARIDAMMAEDPRMKFFPRHGFPGDYTKLRPPVPVKAEMIAEVVDWLVRRLH